MRTTEGFHLSPVALDDLPGIGAICHGEIPAILRDELQKAMTDACDPRTRWDASRTVSFTLTCLPDAERGSCVWDLESVVTKLAGARRPRRGRVVFQRSDDVLVAGVRSDDEPEPEPMDDSAPIALGVDVAVLLGGELDLAFKRASVEIYLDIDDTRKKAAEKRSVAFTIAVAADEDRSSVRLELKPVKVKRAKGDKSPAQRLFVNRQGSKLVAGLEPDAYLPRNRDNEIGDVVVGHQTVTPFPNRAS